MKNGGPFLEEIDNFQVKYWVEAGATVFKLGLPPSGARKQQIEKFWGEKGVLGVLSIFGDFYRFLGKLGLFGGNLLIFVDVGVFTDF